MPVTTDSFDGLVRRMYAAQYLIEKRVPGWEADAASLLAFVEQHLIFNNISNVSHGLHVL